MANVIKLRKMTLNEIHFLEPNRMIRFFFVYAIK